MFREDNVLGLPVPVEAAIIIYFLWSLASFTFAHAKGLTGHRDYFPFISKLILLSSVLLATIVRIMAITFFFAPSLGLFNLLRHYQGMYIL